MSLDLRRATADDVPAIRALVDVAYARYVPVIGREPAPMVADYDRAVRDHRIDLLSADDRLVALIELVCEPDCLLIENVAVAPAQAGRGHGRALMAHAVDVARVLGRKRVRLYTNRLMEANIALYRRLGYAIDREETSVDGFHRVHMSMMVELAPPS
jgi:GNAT superfamily N-acetyltransferase